MTTMNPQNRSAVPPSVNANVKSLGSMISESCRSGRLGNVRKYDLPTCHDGAGKAQHSPETEVTLCKSAWRPATNLRVTDPENLLVA